MNTLKHIFLLLQAIPFLPYMWYYGKKIKKEMPQLPEPTDINGTTKSIGQTINLLALGESTIAGVGVDSHRDGITGQMADYLSKKINKKINWKIFAKSGLTAKDLCLKLKNENIKFRPDIIVIGLGANDAFHLNSPFFFQKYILQLIAILRKKFAAQPIVFINVPPISLFPAFPKIIKYFMGSTVQLYRNELIDLANKYPNIWFYSKKLEDMDWGINERTIHKYFSDGVHPSKITYGLWGRAVGQYVLDKKIL
ncbi:MAG TPA: SGNH/GDSL hydrolase family protein [Bacteroidetes bacterium]|nr:SGNH/GDSL hydrolase family protein [Bacteroidota bacterium]